MKTFEDYIKERVEKFGEEEKKSFRKIEDNLFESDRYLAIHLTNALTNVGFIFVCSNKNKFYYRNI
ncbi:hypothetical protein [Flavobacterium psychrophilum]|uniref:hypothetical protein n=1 Tax=Flavobacterium psychrophilum TaxID=96345 RepID=UPI00106BD72F|nr:hypothetical protein [Flavobacterium psychrophilum]